MKEEGRKEGGKGGRGTGGRRKEGTWSSSRVFDNSDVVFFSSVREFRPRIISLEVLKLHS